MYSVTIWLCEEMVQHSQQKPHWNRHLQIQHFVHRIVHFFPISPNWFTCSQYYKWFSNWRPPRRTTERPLWGGAAHTWAGQCWSGVPGSCSNVARNSITKVQPKSFFGNLKPWRQHSMFYFSFIMKVQGIRLTRCCSGGWHLQLLHRRLVGGGFIDWSSGITKL